MMLSTEHIQTIQPSTKFKHRFTGPSYHHENHFSHSFINLTYPIQCQSTLFFMPHSSSPTSQTTYREHILHPPPIAIEQEKEFEVESVLSKRIHRRKPQYLVKWKGYPTRNSTWNPSNLKHCKKPLNNSNTNNALKSGKNVTKSIPLLLCHETTTQNISTFYLLLLFLFILRSFRQ